jgi:hypothetical protein
MTMTFPLTFPETFGGTPYIPPTPITTWPSGPITPYGAYTLNNGVQPLCSYVSPDASQIFWLMGGLAPMPTVQPGVLLQKIPKGLLPPWKLLDQQGARQDGVTNMGAVLDPITIEMQCLISGWTPGCSGQRAVFQKRQVTRAWIDSWGADAVGEFGWQTPQAGKWWGSARWAKSPTDAIPNAVTATQVFKWTARIDSGVYQSVPSTSQFPAVGASPLSGSASGWLPLCNRGDRPAWPPFLCYGPFDLLSLSNGPGSTTMITFGPLLAGQCVLINSDMRLPLIVDLSQTAVAQALTPFQSLLSELVSFATNGNTVPLLAQFESVFGILPPQTNLEALVTGRFTNAVPAKPIAAPPVTSSIAVSVTGATSTTRIIAGLTPLRRYPE